MLGHVLAHLLQIQLTLLLTICQILPSFVRDFSLFYLCLKQLSFIRV